MKMKIKLIMALLTVLQTMACESDTKELSSTTLHTGFNGLNKVSKVNIFENEPSVRASWLKSALTPIELDKAIKKIDFNKQFILIFSIGKRPNASGKITIDPIKYTTDPNAKIISIDTIINIGVVDYIKCNITASIESYPFIVQVIERPKEKETFLITKGSHGVYNFPDIGCLTPVTGKATEE